MARWKPTGAVYGPATVREVLPALTVDANVCLAREGLNRKTMAAAQPTSNPANNSKRELCCWSALLVKGPKTAIVCYWYCNHGKIDRCRIETDVMVMLFSSKI